MNNEKNWRDKSIEILENNFWPEPEIITPLVAKCHLLRKKPLNEFNVENLRVMVEQQVGLRYLIPLALEKLKENILAEGMYFEGDLLQVVFNIDYSFWQEYPEHRNSLEHLVQNGAQELKEASPDLYRTFIKWKDRT